MEANQAINIARAANDIDSSYILETLKSGFNYILNEHAEYFIYASILLASIFIFALVLMDKKNKDKNATKAKKEADEIKAKQQEESKTNSLTMQEAREVIDYMNLLIQEKFNYHLHSKLLPLYVSGKTPEIKVIKEIKDHIYLSIITSLSPALKNKILKYHTNKGLDIMIHERIMSLLNEIDFTMTKNKSGEVFKGINMQNVDKIL